MTSSILTNAGAMTALQTLRKINRDLGTTQDRISTGLKVQNAKDNASFWAVAQVMKSDVSTFKAITDNLSLASNAASVARDGSQQIAELIKEIKNKAAAAQEGSIDKNKIQRDIDQALKQIDEIVDSAQFNGVNLLKEDKELQFLSSIGREGGTLDPSYIKFDVSNMSRDDDGDLAMLDGLSVLGRGDGIYTNATDGSAQTKLTLSTANATGTSEANGRLFIGDDGLSKGGTLKFTYVDAKNITQTVSITTTADIGGATATSRETSEDFAEQLMANTQISSNFTVTVGFNDEILVTPKLRDSGVTFSSIAVGGSAIDTAGTDPALATDTVDAEDIAQQIEMTFQDAPLRLNEEFNFKLQANGTKYDVVFRVTADGTDSGTLLDASDNKLVLALDARQVTQEFTTGATIVTEIEKALLKAIDPVAGPIFTAGNRITAEQAAAAEAIRLALGPVFDNTAATGEFNYVVNNNKLTLTVDDGNSAAGTAGGSASGNDLISFQAPQSDFSAILRNIEAALEVALDTAASLGSAQKRIEIQQDFLKSLVDNLNVGIGTLVDADMNEESARLQALQVQQQLGVQALSIANQAPQSILSLFRN